MGWKIRPDCVVEGCDSETARSGTQYCRDHDPRRCQATVSEATYKSGGLSEERRCRATAAKGNTLCKRHLREKA